MVKYLPDTIRYPRVENDYPMEEFVAILVDDYILHKNYYENVHQTDYKINKSYRKLLQNMKL